MVFECLSVPLERAGTYHMENASIETSASSKYPANRVRAITYHTSKLMFAETSNVSEINSEV